MFIEKPRIPEELYKFFTKGMPLNCRKWRGYRYNFKRKGWNVYINFVRFSTNPSIDTKFYSYSNSYSPDWELKVHQYVISKTN